MANPLYLSQIRVGASEWTAAVNVDGVAKTLTVDAGTYYLDSDTASESLRQEIADQLETLYPAKAFTVTWSTTTGKFTFAIDALAPTWSFTCNQDEFAAWLGFTSGTPGWGASASLTRTSTNPCAGAIFTDSGRARFKGLQRNYTNGSVPTQSGLVAQIGTGTVFRTGDWEHPFEPELAQSSPLASGVRPSSIVDGSGGTTSQAWTWEDFFDHHCTHHTGEPFRYYWEAADTIDAYEAGYVLMDASFAAFLPDLQEEGSTRYSVVKLAVAWHSAGGAA